MKFFLSILFWLLPFIAPAQIKDSLLQTGLNKTSNIQSFQSIKSYKPEILTSGFIDIVNNGQVNASARFIRLLIGSKAMHLSEKNVLKRFFPDWVSEKPQEICRKQFFEAVKTTEYNVVFTGNFQERTFFHEGFLMAVVLVVNSFGASFGVPASGSAKCHG